MSLDKFVGGEDRFEIKRKPRAVRFTEEIPERKNDKPVKKNDRGMLNLIVAVIVILGIIGLVFGYTKDKIKEVSQGGKGLEAEVLSLKSELAGLQEKANSLEKENITNKSAVIDLFEKQRTIPENVNTTDWNILTEKDLSFSVSFPKKWEKVNAIVSVPEGSDKKSEILYLQPINESLFANGLTIKSDYADFANLKMEEKIALFKDLNLIDTFANENFTMLYFINLDENNQEIPTIIILTPEKIYRATFNVFDKKVNNYFEFRKNFEEIVSTFKIVKVEEPVAVDENAAEKVDPAKKK